jgi:ArsR family transcriptional regulator, arsenate/arsenite/antimonite-responsive transcriptional repressor / arsenate reductase (thioredoxin)
MAHSGQGELPTFVRVVGHPVRWRLVSELARSDLRVRELVGLVGEPQNLVSYHLRLLRGEGLVTATRSTHDGRDSYYHLDLERCGQALSGVGVALHPALRVETVAPVARRSTAKLAVLFLCTGNSARSPIAEALLRHHTNGRVAVTSAGSRPKPRIHPNAVRVLRERYGIDIAGRRPRTLDSVAGRRFDQVISLCDKVREVCPEFGHDPERVHWSIPDPAAGGGDDRTSYPVFERVAADIDTRIRYLLPVLAHEPEEA